jgi:hypothetical protein
VAWLQGSAPRAGGGRGGGAGHGVGDRGDGGPRGHAGGDAPKRHQGEDKWQYQVRKARERVLIINPKYCLEEALEAFVAEL